jgi:hypothetical protein
LAAAAAAAIMFGLGSAIAQVLTEKSVPVHTALTNAQTALAQCGDHVSVA